MAEVLRPGFERLGPKVEIVGELDKGFADGMRIVISQTCARTCVAENLPHTVRVGPGRAINRNRLVLLIVTRQSPDPLRR